MFENALINQQLRAGEDERGDWKPLDEDEQVTRLGANESGKTTAWQGLKKKKKRNYIKQQEFMF